MYYNTTSSTEICFITGTTCVGIYVGGLDRSRASCFSFSASSDLKQSSFKTRCAFRGWEVYHGSKEMSCFCDISRVVCTSLKSWLPQRSSYNSRGGDHFRRVALCQLEVRS